MNVEAHKKAIWESLDIIKESIERGIENRQRTIGFHCSAAAVDFLEIYLHTKNLIDPGTTIKHDWFSSGRKAREHLNVQFENKEMVLDLIVELETKRNMLCYGKPQPKNAIEEYVLAFNRIKELFEQMGVKV